MHHTVLPIAALAFVLGLAGTIPARAEIVTVPPVATSSPAAELPPPTVLRGSPPSAIRPIPIPMCPPGSVPAPGTGCVAPTPGDYAEGWPESDYWPDYWYGYPGYGYSGFGYGRGHVRRLHGLQSSHHAARFGGFKVGAVNMGGFGRR
jgi:hypothetical protein